MDKENDNLQGKLAFACLVAFVPALTLGVITYFIYGIGDIGTIDHYCSSLIIFLCGMAVAFNMARKWVKQGTLRS